MIVCKEMGKKGNPIPAHNEGAVGTSLSRQVEELREPHRAPAPSSCMLAEIWQPDPKGLLQIFGDKPRDFPTFVLLAEGENTLCQVGANPAPQQGFVLGLLLGSKLPDKPYVLPDTPTSRHSLARRPISAGCVMKQVPA